MGQAFATCCSTVKDKTKKAYEKTKQGVKKMAKKVYKFTAEGLGKFGRIFRSSKSTRNQVETDKQVENYHLKDDVYYAPDYFQIQAKIEEKEVKGGFVQSSGEIVYEPNENPDAAGKCAKKAAFTYNDQIEEQLELDYVQDDLKFNQIIIQVRKKSTNFF